MPKKNIQKAKEVIRSIREKGEKVVPIIKMKAFVKEMASRVGKTGKNESLKTEVA